DGSWTWRFDFHVLLSVLGFRGNGKLRAGLQISGLLRLLALALYRIHDPLLVSLESLAELGRPVHLLTHVVNNLGKQRQILCAGAETSLFHRIAGGVALKVLILDQPISKVEDFLGCGSGDEQLAEQLVGIECNGSNQIVYADLRRLARWILSRLVL